MAKVKMYKTTTCPYCKMETEYLTSEDGSQASILGFDRGKIDQDLGIA